MSKSKPLTVEECDAHLFWLRHQLQRAERRGRRLVVTEEEEETADEHPGRSAGRHPLRLGARVYPAVGYQVTRPSSRATTMFPRVVLGANVDPFTPDDFLGPGAYDIGKY
jgi:hypothetical protein